MDLAPIVEMKNKPHPKGLLFYGLLSKTQKHSLPIILATRIILNPQGRSPIESMYTLLKTWPSKAPKPLLVADAAFTTFNSLNTLTSLGWNAVLSLRKSYAGPAGILLSSFNTKDGSIAVKNSAEIVLSVQRKNNAEKKDRVKIVISNACGEAETKSFPHMEDLPTQNEHHVKVSGINEKLDGEYSKAELMNLKLAQLKPIASHFSIPTSGKKEHLVARLYKWLSSKDYINQSSSLIKALSKIKTNKKSDLHTIYYENFNAQDNFNKELLDTLPKFKTHSWRNKLSYSLIMSHLLNAFAIFSEKYDEKKYTKNDFLEQVAKSLLQ